MEETREWQHTWHSLRELLGSKWAFHVLRALTEGECRFSELERAVEGMTATMLSRRLKELACHGFVERSVSETHPPRTTYRLTPSGQEFAHHLRAMEDLVSVRDCADGEACAPDATDSRCLTLADC